MTKATQKVKAATVVHAAKSKARKPRKDAGKKHAPGAGRPAGRTENAVLRQRMTNLDKWLSLNATCIKPNGIAGLARVTSPDLSKMRSGSKPLDESAVTELEKAAAKFKYNPNTTY